MKWGAVALTAGLAVLLGTIWVWTWQGAPYRRSAVDYAVPDVTLLNQRGEAVKLRECFQTSRPLLLEFTFTSCTSICPAQAVLFSNLQRRLPAGEEVNLVSISVDPEVDTPAVLGEYLTHYQAQPGWDFLTGSRDDIRRVMEAFRYRPTDMVSLDSAMILRSGKDGQWFRIDGQLDTESLLAEYQRLVN